jgi:hypothetical protein
VPAGEFRGKIPTHAPLLVVQEKCQAQKYEADGYCADTYEDHDHHGDTCERLFIPQVRDNCVHYQNGNGYTKRAGSAEYQSFHFITPFE